MRRLAVLLALGSSLALIPATAQAAAPAPARAAGIWYWTEGAMEDAFYDEFDIYYVECYGESRRWRGKYKKFRCYSEYTDEDGIDWTDEDIARPTSRYTFRWYNVDSF